MNGKRTEVVLNAKPDGHSSREAQSHLQDDTQKTKAQISSDDMSSSGGAALAVQAFMAFQADVQHNATQSRSGAVVNVYA